MNKRIEELIWECAIPAEKAIDYAKSNNLIQVPDHTLDVVKFAQLIIQECMKVAASQRNPANLNYKPSERFVEDLRQHFGVE